MIAGIEISGFFGFPVYITLFLILMSIYHAAMYSLMKETKKSIHSRIWDNITFGNYWGVLLTIATSLLLYRLSLIGIPSEFLIIAAFFDVLTHYSALITSYYLSSPILKSLSIFKIKYISAFTIFPIIILFSANLFRYITFPKGRIDIIFFYVIFSLIIILYFTLVMKIISGKYSDLGFVYKPFLIGTVGGVFYLISVLIIIFVILKFPSTEQLNELYYYVLFYSALFTFALLQFLIFIVDFPSAIEPRWKAYMPIDSIRLTATFTAIFFAVSFYFTAQDSGFSVVVPAWALAIVGVLFIPTAALFLYTRAFSGETTLGYWNYIKWEIAVHLILSFFILSTAILSWGNINSLVRILYGIFFSLSFLFYLSTMLDIRKLTLDLNVKAMLNTFTLLRYALSTFSLFFIIFSLVFLSMGNVTSVDLILGKYPNFPIMLIGVFFIFYFAFLRRTHKGFEELLERGASTIFSYVAALGVFISLFIIYLKVPSSVVSQFPFFGIVFFGYFAILVADVYSTTTLRVKEYSEKKDIIDLLNHVAGHFFRTDVLEEMWDEVVETFKVLDPELEKARFYPPERTFDLDMVNEKARVSAAVAMLYKMNSAAKEEGVPVVPFDDDIVKEIETLLGEKILLLPQDLSKDFKGKDYYTRLLEFTFASINAAIKPFISFEDYSSVLKKLTSIDVFFNNLAIDEHGVRIKKVIELSKNEFLQYLKLYIRGLEITFPFNRLLLRETVKSEVKSRLSLYGFTQADVLNVVPTGVKELDEVLYGGLIKGTSTLLLSEERRAKNDVLFMFISEGLKEDEPGLFATSRIASSDLLKAFKRDAEPCEKLEIIDLYLSTHTENAVQIPVTKGERHIISTSLIQVKQAVVAAVKKHKKEEHKRIVLDIYSDLSKYQNHKEIINLIVKQIEGFKRWNATSIVTLAPDLSTVELERHFDNVFLLSDVSTIKIKKLFGGKPKKDSLIIWGTYAPMEEPDYSLFYKESE